MSKKQTRTLAVDFDGVLHRYQGYRGGHIDGPIRGARSAIERLLAQGHAVVVFTTRDADTVRSWLTEHKFPPLEVTDVKRPFWLLLDDRAMHFDGQWDGVVERINAFRPYWIGGHPAPAEDAPG